MKKEFKEPELKRIELRLEERIANGSGDIIRDTVGILYTLHTSNEEGASCIIQI